MNEKYLTRKDAYQIANALARIGKEEEPGEVQAEVSSPGLKSSVHTIAAK